MEQTPDLSLDKVIPPTAEKKAVTKLPDPPKELDDLLKALEAK